MKTTSTHDPLTDYRFRARRLLKDLRSADPVQATSAAVRLLQLRSFAPRTVQQVLDDKKRIQLKHALLVVALEEGHPSWRDLKSHVEANALSDLTVMYAKGLEALLNRWFARYEDARASLEAQGGFLFSYRTQFFVCESEGVRELGLDPRDPDWERIGWDWVKPADRAAWERLRDRRRRVVRNDSRGRSSGNP